LFKTQGQQRCIAANKYMIRKLRVLEPACAVNIQVVYNYVSVVYNYVICVLCTLQCAVVHCRSW